MRIFRWCRLSESSSSRIRDCEYGSRFVTHDMSACRSAQVSLSILRASSSCEEMFSGMASSCSSSSLYVQLVGSRMRCGIERRTAESRSVVVWEQSHLRDGGGTQGCPCWPDIPIRLQHKTRTENQPSAVHRTSNSSCANEYRPTDKAKAGVKNERTPRTDTDRDASVADGRFLLVNASDCTRFPYPVEGATTRVRLALRLPTNAVWCSRSRVGHSMQEHSGLAPTSSHTMNGIVCPHFEPQSY